jgi:hypothetical protein
MRTASFHRRRSSSIIALIFLVYGHLTGLSSASIIGDQAASQDHALAYYEPLQLSKRSVLHENNNDDTVSEVVLRFKKR